MKLRKHTATDISLSLVTIVNLINIIHICRYFKIYFIHFAGPFSWLLALASFERVFEISCPGIQLKTKLGTND